MSKHDLTETHEVIGRFIRFEDGDPVRLIFDTASLDRIKQAGPVAGLSKAKTVALASSMRQAAKFLCFCMPTMSLAKI